MAFTRTVTLYGAELSSFLAAGGQTIDPSEPAATPEANALNFPVAVSSSTPVARAAQITTTPIAIAPTNRIVTLPGGPSSSSSRAAAASVVASLGAPLARTASSSAITTKATSTTARAATTTSSTRRASSSASAAANLGNANKQSDGLSGGAIAGIVIGVLALLAALAAALFLWRKRKSDKRRRSAAAAAKSSRNPEKGAYRLDETEVPGGGFDFGPLVPIAGGAAFGAAAAGAFGRNTPVRSASPALTLDRAAILGIQRPLTPSAVPPPGHPANGARVSPSLQQGTYPQQHQQQQQAPYPTSQNPAMRMASGAALMPVGSMPQQQQRGFDTSAGQANMPRTPVPAMMQTPGSNPFADGVHNSTSMSSMTAPLDERSAAPGAATAAAAAVLATGAGAAVVAPALAREATHDKRPSVSSFAAGDDSLEESVPAVAERAESPTEPFKKHDSAELKASPVVDTTSESVAPAIVAPVAVAPAAAAIPAVAAAAASSGDAAPIAAGNGPARSKSMAAAADDWAARKEHLKKTLASSQHSRSPQPSPAAQQDPFGDQHATPPPKAVQASPSLQDTPVLSPMDFSFATQLGEESADDATHA